MLNVHRTKTDWAEFAKDWGYQSMREMLYDLYITKYYSTARLGAALGVRKDRAAQLLREYDIPVRSRGGYNRV